MRQPEEVVRAHSSNGLSPKIIERSQDEEECPESVRTPAAGEAVVSEPSARYTASCGGETGGKGSDGGGT